MAESPKEWRVIPGFPDYEVSEFGEIRRIYDHHLRKVKLRAGQAVSQSLAGPRAGKHSSRRSANRYWRVWLHNRESNRRTRCIVSRIVCEAFHGPPPEGMPFACHNDGDRNNNNYRNLRWDSPAGNTADQLKHHTALLGERNGGAVITEKLAIEILDKLAAGEKSCVLASKIGVPAPIIRKLRAGRTWGHIPRPPSPYLYPIKPSRSKYA